MNSAHHYSDASISARVRDFRKLQFGGYEVQRQLRPFSKRTFAIQAGDSMTYLEAYDVLRTFQKMHLRELDTSKWDNEAAKEAIETLDGVLYLVESALVKADAES